MGEVPAQHLGSWGRLMEKYGSEQASKLQGTSPSHGIYKKYVDSIFTKVDDIDLQNFWGPSLGTRVKGWVC